ncbi:MAG: type II toxin-antitoxin system RelE/ParE family toxin [Planctomycetota bacterium]
MHPIEFGLVASDEVEAARDYLEKEAPGLGERFTNLLALTLDRISAFPESSPVTHRDLRCTLVPTFRYRVFYRIETSRIVILSVRHPSRDVVSDS